MRFILNGSTSKDILQNVLDNREIDSDLLGKLLNPTKDEVESVYNYRDMKKATLRVLEAIKNNEKILILADTDVDGYTSTTILYVFITVNLGYKNVEIIMQGNAKAHGLTKDVMENTLGSEAKLLICPDSSSSDFEQHKVLIDNGIDVLIVDHHQFEIEKLDDRVIIVNNQMEGVLNKNLSGVGVTYRLIEAIALNLGIDLKDTFLDLVAIGNIGDIMDLRNLENRYFVSKGLKNIKNKLILGFLERVNITNPNIIDISFNVVPLINSVIRMGKDEEKRFMLETLIEGCNPTMTTHITVQSAVKLAVSVKGKQDRKVRSVVEKLEERIREKRLLDNRVLILNVTEFSESTINGLIASRLASKYKRPCMIFVMGDDGIARGSARGYKCNDLKSVCNNTELFDWCLGHEASFGYQIPLGKLIEANLQFNNIYKDVEFELVHEVDYIFKANTISKEDIMLIADIYHLFGSTIQEPLFYIEGVKVNARDIRKIGTSTYIFNYKDLSFIKLFGSKIFYADMIKLNDYPQGDANLELNIIGKFKRNNNGYYQIEIVDLESKIDEELMF